MVPRMLRRLLVSLVLPSLCLFGGTSAAGQEIEVRDCSSECPLSVTHTVTLGDEGPGFIGTPVNVVATSSGGWIVFDFRSPSRVKVFDSAGQFMKTIGRGGDGPGEYEMAVYGRILPADTLEIVDFGHLRITALDPNRDVVGTRPVGMRFLHLAFLPDGRHITNARVATQDHAGLPLHLVDRSGTIVRSFGASPPISQLMNTDLHWRELAPDGGGIWAAHLTSYRIERWDTLGNRQVALRRNVGWFPDHDDYGTRSDPEERPNPGVTGLHLDDEGRIWTIVTRPDPEYQEAFGQGEDPYGRPTEEIRNLHDYWDTLVEVIDPTEGIVLGRAQLDQYVTDFTSNGMLYVVVEDADSAPRLEIWAVDSPR